VELLRISRSNLELFERLQQRLLVGLKRQPLLQQRIERLKSIDGVGEILALSWALETPKSNAFRRAEHPPQVPERCSRRSAERTNPSTWP
jgi:hypothetical protein